MQTSIHHSNIYSPGSTGPVESKFLSVTRLVGILAGLVVAGAMPCASNAAIISYDGGGSAVAYDWNGAIPVTIGANSITVTSLGVMDVGGDGFEGTQTAYIAPYSGGVEWSVSANVTSSDTLIGNYRYVSITPFVMEANTTYFVGARLTGGTSFIRDDSTPRFTPGDGVSAIGASWFNNDNPPSTLTPNNYGNSGVSWAPGNALVVPEPAALALLLLGGVGLLRRHR
ncbi:MAG: PEP-CTERM sorting domain-containing protein [Lentisphaeria bacterium]